MRKFTILLCCLLIAASNVCLVAANESEMALIDELVQDAEESFARADSIDLFKMPVTFVYLIALTDCLGIMFELRDTLREYDQVAAEVEAVFDRLSDKLRGLAAVGFDESNTQICSMKSNLVEKFEGDAKTTSLGYYLVDTTSQYLPKKAMSRVAEAISVAKTGSVQAMRDALHDLKHIIAAVSIDKKNNDKANNAKNAQDDQIVQLLQFYLDKINATKVDNGENVDCFQLSSIVKFMDQLELISSFKLQLSQMLSIGAAFYESHSVLNKLEEDVRHLCAFAFRKVNDYFERLYQSIIYDFLVIPNDPAKINMLLMPSYPLNADVQQIRRALGACEIAVAEHIREAIKKLISIH